jgi:RND family efflux transporter MFP subunit
VVTHRLAFPSRIVPVLTVLSILSFDRAFAQGRPQPVVVDPVRREKLVDRRMVTGEIRAVRVSRVAAREPGLVMRIEACEGQTVEEGARLAKLDDVRLRLELDVQEAARRVAEVTVEERKVALEQAARDLESLTRLDERGAANPKELADARTAHLAATTRVTEAEAAVQEAVRRADLLRQRIADTEIKAPFKAFVVTKVKDLGEWVGTGEAVFDLISVGPVDAWLEVPQRMIDAVRATRAPVTIEIDATGRSVVASELRIVPRVDESARVFPLVARLENADGTLAAGMSVTAWVPSGAEVEHLTVSKDAVLRSETGPFLYVARGGGEGKPAMAVPVKVKPLFTTDGRIAVKAAGLQPGDPVVVEGNERLFPMSPVIPMPRAAAGPGGGPPAGKPEGGAPAGGKPGPEGTASKEGKQP